MRQAEPRTLILSAHAEVLMSLKPQTFDPVPAETARVAQAAFPQGNTYIQMRDVFGAFYADEAFAPSFLHGANRLRCCSLPRACRIGRRRMQCVGALTGSMLSS